MSLAFFKALRPYQATYHQSSRQCVFRVNGPDRIAELSRAMAAPRDYRSERHDNGGLGRVDDRNAKRIFQGSAVSTPHSAMPNTGREVLSRQTWSPGSL